MNRKLTLLLVITFITFGAFAQTASNKIVSKVGVKGQLIGLHFDLADFNGPSGIKDPITGKVYPSFSAMDKGVSLSYWRGFCRYADLSVKVNCMMKDYRAQYYNIPPNNSELGLELEPTLNIRPYGDNAKIAPFLTAGVGGGFYTSHFGAYVPVGLGLQANFNNTTYLFVQSQYKFTLTKKVLGDNLFYSIGFAENIGRDK